MTVYRNSSGHIFWSKKCENVSKALDFALDEVRDDYEKVDFLRDWREGDVSDWPEFIKYVGHTE